MNRLILFTLFFALGSLFRVVAQHDHSHYHKMCVHTKSYAAMEAKGQLVPYEFDRRCLRDDDILIEILYSGICHSDIHMVNGDWGGGQYPIVPGHEIVGRVVQVGKSVKKFRVGDIAGVGCMVGSCGECEYCKAGEEQYCTNRAIYTYGSEDEDEEITKGGYASNIVVNELFAITIPKNAPLEKIAPLMCAGITTYSPMQYNHVKKGDRVAVAGFGGLGHMAVQYALKMGAEVTVFDITEEKRQLANDMGVSRYVNVKNPGEMDGFGSSFDLIVSTIPTSYQIEPYLYMLKVDGTLVILGLPPISDAPSINMGALVSGRRKVYFSLIGGIRETQEMLDYSVKNNIYPMVEIIPIQQVNDAYKKVMDGEVHFRYVIDMSSLK